MSQGLEMQNLHDVIRDTMMECLQQAREDEAGLTTIHAKIPVALKNRVEPILKAYHRDITISMFIRKVMERLVQEYNPSI